MKLLALVPCTGTVLVDTGTVSNSFETAEGRSFGSCLTSFGEYLLTILYKLVCHRPNFIFTCDLGTSSKINIRRQTAALVILKESNVLVLRKTVGLALN